MKKKGVAILGSLTVMISHLGLRATPQNWLFGPPALDTSVSDTSVQLEPTMTVKILSACDSSWVLRPRCRTRRPRPPATAVPWCAVRRLGRPRYQPYRGSGVSGRPGSAASAGPRSARKDTRR